MVTSPIPEPAVPTGISDGLSLRDAYHLVMSRWRLLAVCIGVFAAAAAAWALLSPKIYRGEVIMVPVASGAESSNVSALLGQLGGIVGAAGLGLGSSDPSAEYLALIQSPQFIEEFLAAHELLPLLFDDKWSTESKTWRDDAPTLQDGYRVFTRDVLAVRQDRDTHMVMLSTEWRDPVLAASWANELVAMANAKIRARAIAEAQASIDYLNSELEGSGTIEIRSSIFRLIETQLNTMMLAKGRPEYAFRVVSAAQTPQLDQYVRPRPVLMLVLGVICGGLAAVIYILARFSAADDRHSRAYSSAP